MKVGVVGATSHLGGCVMEALRERGLEPVALVRRPVEGVENRACDLLDPHTFPEALTGLEAVVSVAGAPVVPWPTRPRCTFEAVDRDGHAALGLAAAEAGVRRFVYVSVHGDGSEHLPYVKTHYDAEDALEAAGLELAAIRPVGLFRAFEQLLPTARWGVAFDIAGGRAKTNPLSEEDLGELCAEQVVAATPTRRLPVGGPEVMTRRDVWDLCFEAWGVRGVHLPSFQIGLNAAALPMQLVDRRAADVIRFVGHVLCHPSTAPTHGTRRLGPHLKAIVRRGR